ncbi:MAG: hypothetical protein HYT03_00960 [Candidatus Harrisonbacteria bacterium]|nr:hypothetical protein [Candidatus Harrisonbacteria bacterium]
MLFRAELICEVLPKIFFGVGAPRYHLKDTVNHGSVYVEVVGTTNAEVAELLMRRLIEHRCHILHEQAGMQNCSCGNFFREIEKISWRGEREDRDKRNITATVMGGRGEVLSWYSIGTKLTTEWFTTGME